jgi:hypothetical protein
LLDKEIIPESFYEFKYCDNGLMLLSPNGFDKGIIIRPAQSQQNINRTELTTEELEKWI